MAAYTQPELFAKVKQATESGEKVDPKTGENAPRDREFGMLSGGFKSINFNLGTMVIEFEDDHSLDGYKVYHQFQEPDDAILTRPAPEFGGSKQHNIQSVFDRTPAKFPTREFTLAGYEGDFGPGINLVGEQLATVDFIIPDTIQHPKLPSGDSPD